jgi:hypothetical protein
VGEGKSDAIMRVEIESREKLRVSSLTAFDLED